MFVMNASGNDLPQSHSFVPFRSRTAHSRVKNIICAIFLAALVSIGGSVKAQNMLINPGAETGDLTGWNQSTGGYKYVVSTNQFIPNSGNSNYLAHSGKYTFELFDTTADTSYIYQDFPAIAGSQWSASSDIIGYASNYFGAGSSAEMMVVFFDTNDNVVPYPPSAYGTLGSVILDTYGIAPPYDMILPPAVDASGWVYLQPTNMFTSYPYDYINYGFDTSGPYPTTLTAPPGTAYVRYQLEYDNTADPAGQPVYFDDCVLNKVVGSDPDISVNPVAVTLYASGSPSFSVTATHNNTYPTEKFKYQWYFNKTNLLTPGMNQISSSTTAATLNFTNVQGSASGLYDVVVTLTSAGVPVNSIRSVPVLLNVLVLSPIQKVNLFGANAGFENAPSFLPFNIFNGCYLAGTPAGSTYDGTTPVVPYDGKWTALVGANGNPDNGFYAKIPVTPGQALKVGGYGYISSLNDFAGLNTERILVWFLTASGAPSTTDLKYESPAIYGWDYTNSPDQLYTNIDVSSPNYGNAVLHDQLPRDQWCYIAVTNITDQYFTPASPYPQGPDNITNTLTSGYFIVPADAAFINFEVYENVPAIDGNPADAVYWDEMRFIQVTPVTDLKASVSGGTVDLNFSAGAAQTYTILYKTNLTDTVWNVLTNNVAAPMSWQTNTASVGVAYPVTVTDVPNGRTRFYRVQSQ
jgi:hypothetical protein